MIDGGVGYKSKAALTIPLPKDDVLIHDGRFEFLFGAQVEDLDCSCLSLESNDLFSPVHDGTIGIDGPLDDFIVVLKVNDDDLRFVLFVNFLSNADIVV